MEAVLLHMVELVEGLKKAGLSENSAVRFASIYFNEQRSSEPDDD